MLAMGVTGREIRALRETFGLTNAHFAQLFGVHATSVYRWQACKGEPAIDPFQRSIFEVMITFPRRTRRKLGRELAHQLHLGGHLRGLWWMLRAHYA